MNFIRPIGSAPIVGMEGNSGHLVLGGVAYSINTQNINVLRGRKLSTAALTVAVGAQTVTLSRIGGKNIIASANAITIVAAGVGFSKGWRIPTAAAVYAVEHPTDISMVRGRLLSVGTATYAVAGQALALRTGKGLSIVSALVTINGQNLNYSRTYRLSLATDTIVVGAQNVTLARYAKRIILAPNTITVKFGEVALFKLGKPDPDVTHIYSKPRGKKAFWAAVRKKEAIDPDW